MGTPSASLFVCTGEKFCCVRVVGRANFTTAVDFQILVDRLLAQGFRYFVLDLEACTLMDSTFLGVLAGYGVKLGGTAALGGGALELLNPNQRILDLLENLGVLHLFNVVQGDFARPDGQEAPCEAAHPTKREQTEACLAAHKTLMEVNPENVARFKDVAKFLAEDLKKQG